MLWNINCGNWSGKPCISKELYIWPSKSLLCTQWILKHCCWPSNSVIKIHCLMKLKFIARIHLSDSSANEILGRSLLQILFWQQEYLSTKSDAQFWDRREEKPCLVGIWWRRLPCLCTIVPFLIPRGFSALWLLRPKKLSRLLPCRAHNTKT